MTNPLDDALRKLDESIEHEAKHRAQLQAEFDVRRRRFSDLVTEFLTKMNALGNSCIDLELRAGSFRKVPAWALAYDGGERPSYWFLTVDGRVPTNEVTKKGTKSTLVPYAEARALLDDRQVERLAASMAAKLDEAHRMRSRLR